MSKVMTLFKQWDTDHSGTIDKVEFRKSIVRIGFDAPRAAIDELFDEVDVVRRALRPRVAPAPPPRVPRICEASGLAPA